MMRTLLLTKETRFCEDAGQLARVFFPELEWVKGRLGDPFPEHLANERFAHTISFVSPWIVPQWLIDASDVALNFHPGSAEYPGTGCYNFALYEGAAVYGAICHHMKAKVDTGAVVKESLFTVSARDTVETLKLRTMVAMLQLFHEIAELLATGATLPTGRAWTRKPFTRRQLEALATIDVSMSADEIARRVRATTYPGFPGPKLMVAGTTFRAEAPARAPIA